MTQSAKNSNFQHTDKKDMEDLEKRKTIESFTLMDDIFMRLVFEEKSCTEYVLQVLMNKRSLKVKKQYVQKIFLICTVILCSWIAFAKMIRGICII